MKIELTEGRKFTFILNHNYNSLYRVVIKIANVNGLPLIDYIRPFTSNMSKWWVIPPGSYFNNMYSFIVEVYQVNNLICSEFFEKTEVGFDKSIIKVKDKNYDIFPIDTIEDINLVSENSICFTDSSQYHAYKEIFLDECYWEDSYSNIYKDSTVLDIGSNCGMFSLFAVERGASKVYSFEPIRDNFILTSHNTRDYRDNIFPINAGISDKDEWKNISVDWMGMGISTNERFPAGIEEMDKNKTDSYRAEFWPPNSIFDRLNLTDGADIVKLDCEGGEFEFFEYISDDRLKKIKLILCEWHIQKDSWDRYNDIQSKILNSGFFVNYPTEVYKEKSLGEKEGATFVCFYQNKNNINNNISDDVKEYKEDDYEVILNFGQES